LQYFLGFFLKVGFLHKKDTRAILLKIALVRVSCIQNTQIRGETIAKVFGKVDTFWTYQYGKALALVFPYLILAMSSAKNLSVTMSNPKRFPPLKHSLLHTSLASNRI
jgi:hypothetical protein